MHSSSLLNMIVDRLLTIAISSLGGILTEMVTSKTGIPGASFAALGAFDAFSTLDIKAYELFFNSSISVYGTEYEASFEAEEASKLTAEGYDKSEVQEVIKEKYGEDLRTYSIAFEYMGLIADTLHDGVPFEVVINAKDRLATAFLVNSLEGSACSHISKSCDIRWLCFPDMPPVQYTLGHSSVHYASHAASEFIVGWGGDCADATINEDLIFLPGTAKNGACGSCRREAFCVSNKCSSEGYCFESSTGLMPTFCPDGNRGPCSDSTECVSGRCELTGLADYSCYEQKENGSSCNEHTDCLSGYCNYFFRCADGGLFG